MSFALWLLPKGGPLVLQTIDISFGQVKPSNLVCGLHDAELDL